MPAAGRVTGHPGHDYVAFVDAPAAECSHGWVDDEDELLEPGRSRLPRPARIAGAVLLVAMLVAVFAIRLWPSSNPKGHRAALGTPPPASGLKTVVPSVPPQRQWPTAPSACGGTTDVPIVTGARRPAERTGLRLLVGAGRGLRTVNFDSGRTKSLWTGGPGRPEYVQTVTAALPAYATTAGCRAFLTRLLRIDSAGVEDLGPLRPDQSVLADGTQAWIATSPNSRQVAPTVRPIGGGPVVTLPKQTYPAGIEDGTIVASRRGGHGSVVLLNARTGRVEQTLPASNYPIAAGAGRVVWTSGCNVTADRSCVLDVASLPGAGVMHFPLPRPALSGTVSPDGWHVAMLLESSRADGQLYSGHPFPPSHIGVVDLHTGRLRIIPGITIAAKESPGLAFSADGRWLAIALDAGTRTRLLAWRAGLGPPYQGVSVPGRNYGTPPLIALGG